MFKTLHDKKCELKGKAPILHIIVFLQVLGENHSIVENVV